MPRRGGLTTTRSGTASEARAYAVASAATNSAATPSSDDVALAAAIASADTSTPSTSRPGAGEVERETAHAAVEVPHGADVGQVAHPRAGLVVEGLRDRRVGLEERPRAQPQRHPGGQPHRQRRGVGQHDLALALEHRLVLGLDVDRHHPQRRHRLEQRGQAGADARLEGRRPQHQTQHQLAVGRLGEQHVLELAAPRRDVVRHQAGVADPAGRCGRGPPAGRRSAGRSRAGRPPRGRGRGSPASARRRCRRPPSWPCCGTARRRRRRSAATRASRPASARAPPCRRAGARAGSRAGCRSGSGRRRSGGSAARRRRR